jgi:hypothetical protein
VGDSDLRGRESQMVLNAVSCSDILSFWCLCFTLNNVISKRLGRELNVWFKIKHENILSLEGIAFFDDGPALYTRWCANGDVLRYMRGSPEVDRRKLVSFFKCL